METPRTQPETAPTTEPSRVGTGSDWSTLDWDEIFDRSERMGCGRVLNPDDYELDLG